MSKIKKLFLIIYCLFLTSIIFSQEITLRLGDNNIPLIIDSTRSTPNYKTCVRLISNTTNKIVFENIPENKYQTDDGYGREYTAVDNKLEYLFNLMDTVTTINEINFEFTVDGKKIENLSFCFQVLSTSKRISHSKTTHLKNIEAPQYLNTFLESIINPNIILYAIEFYDNDGNTYIINTGYSNFFVENKSKH